MRSASQSTSSGWEDEKGLRLAAEQLYPGKSFGELTKKEREAIFKSYKGERAQAAGLISAGQRLSADAGKTAGPYNVYYDNPWDKLAGGLMSGYGYGKQGKANKAEAKGREASAEMITRRDALAREAEAREAAEEERDRRAWMESILGVAS